MARAGFTLIELLVVLFVIGAVLALAMPAYDRLLPGLALSAATRELAEALRLARQQALAEGREVAVVFDPDAGMFRRDGADAAQSLPADTRLVVTTARSELGAGGTARIRFFPDGAATGGRVSLERADLRRTIDVNWLTGHVAILP